MPKKYGFKEKDFVVAHVINQILSGRLRSGDRVDRNRIVAELGLSRVPIQEAVVQLEHDGILSTRYHRGAYVERFDADVVREHHEVYGVLSGIASARAAADPRPEVLHRLEEHMAAMREHRDSQHFHDDCLNFRAVVSENYAGPRLQALIRSSLSFIPRAFWVAYLNTHDEMLPFYETEFAAIRAGDPDTARRACVERSAVMARVMLIELERRGVLPASGALNSE
ncbi:MAG: GntR family transcriptional regulator [Mycolicibacterium hassiacum]|jgi:DNA-binding GntR family transcriptional regulator